MIPLGISVALAGTVISFKEAHLKAIIPPILSIPSGNSIFSMLLQKPKTILPVSFNPLPKYTYFSFSQPLKAVSSIVLTVSGSTIATTFSFSKKAPIATATTSAPFIFSGTTITLSLSSDLHPLSATPPSTSST